MTQTLLQFGTHEMGKVRGKYSYEVVNRHNVMMNHMASVGRFLPNDLPVGIRFAGSSIWRKDVCITKRNNNRLYIELVTAGNLELKQDGREVLVEPGMVFVNQLGATLTYRVGPAGFVHKRFFCVEGFLLEAMLGGLGIDKCDRMHLSKPSRFAAIHREALRLMHAGGDAQLRLGSLAYDALLLIANDLSEPNYPLPVRVAINHMYRNLQRTLAIDDLAREAGISSAHLYRLFNEAMRTTPMRFFMAAKMRHAWMLLQQPDLSVKEVAMRVGFCEQSYFSRVFKEESGCSPTEFREKHVKVRPLEAPETAH